MRIYLLNPPFTSRFIRSARWQAKGRGGTLYYPLWLSYATGILEEKYEAVRLVDAPAQGWGKDDVTNDVKQFKPDLVIVDSSFPSLANDIGVAEVIRRSVKDAKTVLVGPPTSQFPEKILRNAGVDIVARFEYDLTISDLAEAINSGKGFKNVKGISYKENGKIVHNPDRQFITSEELDKIPFVSKVYKKHLDIKQYFLSQSLYPEVQIFTGRGCPFKCTFCSWPQTLMGGKYRVRSVQNVVDELQYIKKELPEVKEVFFEDDTFTIDQSRIRAICKEILDRKLKVIWSCNARANLNYETLKDMKKAGCRLLIVGYESGSDEILRNIKKGITIEQMIKFTKEAKKAGLMIHGDFIIGLPGETKRTAESTLRFIKKIRPDILQVAIATPIPGTEFYRWVEEKGFLLVNDMKESIDAQGYQKCIVSYPEFTKEDIEDYVDRALRKYYLSFAYLPTAVKNILRRNGLREMQVMLRAAKAFRSYLGRHAR